MSLITFIRDLQKIPEKIPAPGAILYNAIPAKLLHKPEYKLAQIISEKIESGTIIDLGSGTGYLSIEIAKSAPNVKVCGIDLSMKMVDISRSHAKGIENVRFELGNAAKLPFENNSIDSIVSTGSLHHWKYPVKVFDECYRVLKQGGEGWIYDGYPDFPKDQAEQFKGEFGFSRYKVLSIVLRFHGFSGNEYRTKIKRILDQTKFKDCYQMEPIDMWMKITIKKEK